MTSGVFQSIPIDSIIVEREGRQRKVLDPEDISSLAASIKRVGLIHPIIVTRDDHNLVVGETRLAAVVELGWTHVPAQYQDQVDELELQAVELEENVRRVDLPWQDEVAAIERYHNLKLKMEPTWTKELTAEALGITKSEVIDKLNVAQEVRSDPKMAEVPLFSTARGLTRRKIERRTAAQKAALPSLLPKEEPEETAASADVVLNIDFIDWAREYEGPAFNLIHCDFPYGINADNMNQGNSRMEFGDYVDDPDVYFALLQTFTDHFEKFVEPSAHLVFWFSMKFYTETIAWLRSHSDFVIDDFPLIWTKDKGLLPDPNRGPRRVYETALFGIRGDRKVVRAKNNAMHAPVGEREHMSQKAEPAVRHFFEMLVDNSTSIFDPTAGSGMALAVAESLGAERALGLELNPEFTERANNLIISRRKK